MAQQKAETNNMAARTSDERDYRVRVVSSSRELTAKEKVMLKNNRDGVLINAEVEGGGSLLIDVKDWVELEIHNEKAEDGKDYKNYVVIDKDGKRYVTGSASFWTSFRDIMDDMEGITDEEWKLEVKAVPSKNRPGKSYLKCSIV